MLRPALFSLCDRGMYICCIPFSIRAAIASSIISLDASPVLSCSRMVVLFRAAVFLSPHCRTMRAQLGHLKSLLDSKAGQDDLVSVARAMGDVEETLAVVRESVPGGQALHELQARATVNHLLVCLTLTLDSCYDRGSSYFFS